ncbi:hypothetical protein TRIUR3_27505 [Triticum urartu]|uniref:Uncharacterized protein n=1 Tax=Triticum urartu TaxID=4572 RepID=M8ABZ9_TRIUA|nr:hypothetical protein TRIUR3_27505 [Triticum urartu]
MGYGLGARLPGWGQGGSAVRDWGQIRRRCRFSPHSPCCGAYILDHMSHGHSVNLQDVLTQLVVINEEKQGTQIYIHTVIKDDSPGFTLSLRQSYWSEYILM